MPLKLPTRSTRGLAAAPPGEGVATATSGSAAMATRIRRPTVELPVLTPHGEVGDHHPGVPFVHRIDAEEEDGQLLGLARIAQWPSVHRAYAGDQLGDLH